MANLELRKKKRSVACPLAPSLNICLQQNEKTDCRSIGFLSHHIASVKNILTNAIQLVILSFNLSLSYSYEFK